MSSESLNLRYTERSQGNGKAECVIEGVDSLSTTHHERVQTLLQEVVRLESKASDDGLISSYQEEYRLAANRIRDDIAKEREMLDSALNSLAEKCK